MTGNFPSSSPCRRSRSVRSLCFRTCDISTPRPSHACGRCSLARAGSWAWHRHICRATRVGLPSSSSHPCSQDNSPGSRTTVPRPLFSVCGGSRSCKCLPYTLYNLLLFYGGDYPHGANIAHSTWIIANVSGNA